MRFTPILLLLAFLGCDDDRYHLFVDEGVVCVRGPEKRDLLASSSPVTVVVTLPCAAYCADGLESGCTADLRGDVLTVESHFEYTTTREDCPVDCAIMVADCDLPALPEGRYKVRHGDVEHPLEVGPATDATCVGGD